MLSSLAAVHVFVRRLRCAGTFAWGGCMHVIICRHMSTLNLPMWPSGQRTRPPCAVERDAISGRGLRLSPGASAYQRIISNNFYTHDEHGVNPEQVKGFDGVLYEL